jgi:mannose-6-phosphate isomerase
MTQLYPFTFHPIFKERVWGGRKIETLYGKALPAGRPIGESWEISDRPGDVSVIANGPLAGKDLRWLMEHHRQQLLGRAETGEGRFPLLIKILDAQDTLSLQVHPPAPRAVELGGEPKTEMWFIADAGPESELFVGLKKGTTRQAFENKLRDGSVAECFHRVPVCAGDAMFLPSGRVHAIGSGLVIFEIQQNSDTTYRVFDWNRKGLDGKPRELHVEQGLASIDFEDFEPELVSHQAQSVGSSVIRPLTKDPLFNVELVTMKETESMPLGLRSTFRIIGVVQGRVAVVSVDGEAIELTAGRFCLIPAGVRTELWLQAGSKTLMISPGTARKS